jgi:hypothetical protein
MIDIKLFIMRNNFRKFRQMQSRLWVDAERYINIPLWVDVPWRITPWDVPRAPIGALDVP